MRTPLENCLFFITQLQMIFQVTAITDTLTSITLTNDNLFQSKKYLQLIKSQLMLTQTYVNDLLDLKQIKNGVFSLVSSAFNPNETIKMVVNIFEHQASAKGI